MSSSVRLRETHKKIGGGKTIFNEDAKKLEQNLSETVKNLIVELQELFPSVTFFWRYKIDKKEAVLQLHYLQKLSYW